MDELTNLAVALVAWGLFTEGLEFSIRLRGCWEAAWSSPATYWKAEGYGDTPEQALADLCKNTIPYVEV